MTQTPSAATAPSPEIGPPGGLEQTGPLTVPLTVPVQTEPPSRRRGDLRRAIRLMRRFHGGPRPFVIGAALLVVEALAAVVEPVPIAYLIDYLQGGAPDLRGVGWLELSWPARTQTLIGLTAGIILLAAVNSAADSLAEVCLARGGRVLGYNLRVGMYSHLQRLSLAYHDRRRTGDVLTRVTGDVLVIEDFVVKSVSNLLGSLLVLVGSFAVLLWQSWRVALVALVDRAAAGAGFDPLLAPVEDRRAAPARERGGPGLDHAGDAHVDPAGAELRPRQCAPASLLRPDRHEHARCARHGDRPGAVQLRHRAPRGARCVRHRLDRGAPRRRARRSPSAPWCSSSSWCGTCSSRPARSSASGTRSVRSSPASTASSTCSTSSPRSRTPPTPSQRHRSPAGWPSHDVTFAYPDDARGGPPWRAPARPSPRGLRGEAG